MTHPSVEIAKANADILRGELTTLEAKARLLEGQTRQDAEQKTKDLKVKIAELEEKSKAAKNEVSDKAGHIGDTLKEAWSEMAALVKRAGEDISQQLHGPK